MGDDSVMPVHDLNSASFRRFLLSGMTEPNEEESVRASEQGRAEGCWNGRKGEDFGPNYWASLLTWRMD